METKMRYRTSSLEPTLSSNRIKMTSPLSIRYPGTSRFYQTPYAPSIANPSGPSASRRYHYHDISPPTSIPTKATLLLLHGFPDFSYGWRNLISPLTMVGYRLIIPDLLGYGASSSPTGNDRLPEYSGLSIVEDLKGLLDYARAGQNCKYGASAKDGKGGRVIVVGHDWGSWLAWKFAQYAPERLMGVSGICVPYPVPHSKYLDMKTVAKLLPNFGYQVFFDDPSSTKKIQDKLELFFSIVYRAPGLFTGIDPNTDPFGTPIEERDSTKWVQEGRLEKLLEKGTLPKEADVGASLLKEDEEMKVYLDQFKDRMEGPLNWYRTRKINYECDKNVLKSPSLPASLPAQLQMADLDSALPLVMGQKTPEHVPSVRIDVLKSCGHWAMIEVPGIVSQNMKRWIDEEVVPSEEKGWLGKIGVKL